MKTTTITTLTLFSAAFSLSLGAIPVMRSEGINKLRDEIQKGAFLHHRTGLLDGAPDLFNPGTTDNKFPVDFDNPELPSASQERWGGQGTLNEYEVVIDSSIQSLKTKLTKEWSGSGLIPKVNEGEGLITFSLPVDSSSIHNSVDTSQLEALKAIALKEGNVRFKSFKGRLEYENLEVGYINSRISSVRVRYRRIFKGGIVRGDMSYAYVVINSTGITSELRVKWPKFREVGASFKSISLEDATNKAERQLGEISAISNGKETLYPLKAKLTGMSFAWQSLENNGKILLTPTLSFSGVVDYEGNQIKEPFIDIPLGNKY